MKNVLQKIAYVVAIILCATLISKMNSAKEISGGTWLQMKTADKIQKKLDVKSKLAKPAELSVIQAASAQRIQDWLKPKKECFELQKQCLSEFMASIDSLADLPTLYQVTQCAIQKNAQCKTYRFCKNLPNEMLIQNYSLVIGSQTFNLEIKCPEDTSNQFYHVNYQCEEPNYPSIQKTDFDQNSEPKLYFCNKQNKITELNLSNQFSCGENECTIYLESGELVLPIEVDGITWHSASFEENPMCFNLDIYEDDGLDNRTICYDIIEAPTVGQGLGGLEGQLGFCRLTWRIQ